ncbi:MAG: hypothetical protein HN795_06000 [Flavobacteriaceae bacterium]|jgi:hypothetical protein|nr:hypothetical protein [Flavobacteriaceae bacterium]MBT7459214.1 hypothetical protein [Flavobacteriaceae bacterium]MDG0967152.1 hypothetical protein [Flavobacteriaceae bacterium]
MKVLKTLLLFSFLFSGQLLSGQCSMCRAVLESGADAKMAEQLNDGIVYLMLMPYILVGTIGFIVYRKFSKK